jgi:hypothetical protein
MLRNEIEIATASAIEGTLMRRTSKLSGRTLEENETVVIVGTEVNGETEAKVAAAFFLVAAARPILAQS